MVLLTTRKSLVLPQWKVCNRFPNPSSITITSSLISLDLILQPTEVETLLLETMLILELSETKIQYNTLKLLIQSKIPAFMRKTKKKISQLIFLKIILLSNLKFKKLNNIQLFFQKQRLKQLQNIN